MKTGILTFPNSISYGAALQMYALYKTVGKMGHDVEVLNYHNEYMKAEKHTGKPTVNTSLKDGIKNKVRTLMHSRLYSNFNRFEKQHIKLYPEVAFTDKAELEAVGKRYEAVICGSDQVWNPLITDSDMSYFLSFCKENTKRISYAPSFGIEAFSDDFCENVAEELNKFHAVSVREAPGKELVEKLTDKKAQLVIDPTLLLDSSEWKTLEKKHPAAKGDYILYYAAIRSESLFEKCLEFSKQTGIKIIFVGGNPVQKLKNKNPLLEYAVDASPEEWLYLISNARYVFTNSFHGTAFSIIYRKDFFVEYPGFANSRLVQLLSSLGLEKRAIKEYTDITCDAVDYAEVDVKLSAIRENSLEFLK